MGVIVHFITSNFVAYLYIILFILIFIEEGGVPLPAPGDIYIFLAGIQVAKGDANPIIILIEVVIASILGSSALFWLIAKKGEPILEKYGKYIRLSNEKLDKGKRWFSRYGLSVVIVGRWIPGLRIVMTVVGGLFQLKYEKFAFSIGISSFFWALAYLSAGYLVSKQSRVIFSLLSNLNFFLGYIIYLALFILLGVCIYFYLHTYKKRRHHTISDI